MVRREDILKEIQKEIKEALGCDVDENTVLTEIGDSLELTELVFKLEDKYDVSIPMNVTTIGDLVTHCFPEGNYPTAEIILPR